MTESELKQYFSIYTDCWKLFKMYCNPEYGDEFWEQLSVAADEVYKKYGKKKFVKEIILATINEIERIYKNRKEK